MSSRVPKMKAVLKRATNKILWDTQSQREEVVQYREALLNEISQDNLGITKATEDFVESMIKTRKSQNLTDTGKRSQSEDLTIKFREAVERAVKIEALTDRVQNCEQIVNHTVEGIRKSNRPGLDNIASVTQQMAILQSMRDEQIQSRRDFETRMYRAERSKTMLPASESIYLDPVKQYWLDGCKNYSSEKEPFLHAVDRAPWPLNLIDEDALQEGHEILKAKLAPEEIKQLETANMRLQVHREVIHAALVVAQNTHEQVLYEEAQTTPIEPHFDLPSLEELEAAATE